MSLANLPSPTFSGADLSARVNAALLEARAARRLASVQALLADATLAYGAGSRPVAAGDRVETMDGHAYEVAAASSTDHHLATQGGVRLKVLPGPFGADLRAFGCRLDGSQDDTARLATALAAFDTVLCPAGTYRLASLLVPGGKRIVTAGRGTVFQQAPGQPEGTRMFRIESSNVALGLEGFTLRGNIATDTGEQMHGVLIAAPAGPVSDIRLGDVWAEDLRGDAVLIRQSDASRVISEVSVGWVRCANVLRNGVAVCGARGVRIEGITGQGVGYCHFVIEPDVGCGITENVWVGYVKGRFVSISGSSAAEFGDGIHLGTLDLSPSHSGQPVPAYGPGLLIEDGLRLRNTRRLRIDHLRLEGFARCGAFVIYNPGELGAEMVEVGTLHLRNCALTDTVYRAFVAAGNSRWDIGYVDAACAGNDRRVFESLSNSRIGAGRVDLGAGASFLRNCDDDAVGPLTVTGTGTPLVGCNRITVTGGSLAGEFVAAYCDRCTFIGVRASGSVAAFNSGSEDHAVLGSTLDGSFHALGTALRSHLSPLRFGGQHLWMDGSGRLRASGAAPNADTAGTVVGAQA